VHVGAHSRCAGATDRIDFHGVLARFRKGGFTHGPLIVETLSPAGDLPKLLGEARKARAFVEDFVRASPTAAAGSSNRR
jgi:hypothetical protein